MLGIEILLVPGLVLGVAFSILLYRILAEIKA